MDDPIKSLLASTGWSCEELMQRLQSYKEKEGNKSENKSSEAVEDIKSKENDLETVNVKSPIESTTSELDSVSSATVESNIAPYPKRKFPLDDDDINYCSVISDSDDEPCLNSINKEVDKENVSNCDLTVKSQNLLNNDNELNNSEMDICLMKEENNEIKESLLSLLSKNENEVSSEPERVIAEINEIQSIDNCMEGDSIVPKEELNESESISKSIIQFPIVESTILDSKDIKNDLEIVQTVMDDFKTDILSYDDNLTKNDLSNNDDLEKNNLDSQNKLNLMKIPQITAEFLLKEQNNVFVDKSKETKPKNDLITIEKVELDQKNNSKLNETIDENSSAQEEIRNKVKMQLSNLRTRRKFSLIDTSINNDKEKLSDDCEEQNSKPTHDNENTVINNTNQFIKLDSLLGTNSTIKVRNFSNSNDNKGSRLTDNFQICDKPKTIILSRKSVETSVCLNNSTLENGNASKESNDLGIVILNVQGGVRDIDKDEKSYVETCVDDKVEENTDINVTETIDCALDQLRKIINKKSDRKSTKICIKKDRKLSNKIIVHQSNPQSSNESSNSSFIEVLKPPEEDKEPNKSAFLSNSLDEFLTENSKLNISYNVPKLGAEEALRRTREGTPPALKVDLNRDKKEESQSEGKENKTDKTNISNIKAKTLAEKRKLLQQIGGFEPPDGLVLRKKCTTVPSKESNRSYIWYKGKKIFLRSTLSNVCMGQFVDKTIKKKTPVLKPSITLEPKSTDQSPEKPSLLKELVRRVRYPKKYKPGPLSRKIKHFKSDRWVVSVKTLPEVNLEVEPEIGKPFPAHVISYLPKCDGVLTPDQVEFALSVLHDKNKDKVPFVYKFPIKYLHNQNKIIVRERRKSVENIISPPPEVKPVNRDDIANILDDLIRYVEIKELGDSIIKDDEEVSKELEIEKKSSPLKPQISDKVSTIVKRTGRSKVAMELARLSCKFINVTVDNEKEEEDGKECNKMHCQMGCVCQKKSFAPTHCGKIDCMFGCKCKVNEIIKDIQKITLPPGTDLLSSDTVNHLQDVAKKDMAKVEKDFTQTVIAAPDKTIVLGLNGGKPRRETKPPVKYTSDLSKYKSRKDRMHSASEKNERMQLKHIKKHRCYVSLPKINVTHIIPYCMVHEKLNCECKGLANFPDPPKQPTQLEINNCAKLFEPKYSKKKDFKSIGDSEDNCEIIIVDDDTDNVPLPEKESSSNSNQNSKRKQSFNEKTYSTENIKSLNTDQAIQRRSNKSILVNKDKSMPTIFEGEIVIDLRDLDLLKDLGLKATDARSARLLSWENLMKHYRNKKIHIWCHINQSSRLLINTFDKNPPKFYTNLSNVQSTESDVMTWIKTGQLPSNHNPANFYFIIRPTKNHYEICGICTRNIISQTKAVNEIREINPTKEKIQLACLNYTSLKIFRRLEDGDPNDLHFDDLHYIKLPAPAGGMAGRRWRAIYVLEPFSYIKLERNGYCIRYADIRQVQKKAQCLKKTIVFRSSELYREYTAHSFGVYCDYLCDKFIYVGPFLSNEEANIKTYKTDGSKAASKLFEVKNSFWIVPATDKDIMNILKDKKRKLQFERASKISILKRPNPLAISKLTQSAKRARFDAQSANNELLVPNGKQVLVLQSEPRSEENFNCYIVTNVPQFGYFGAVKHPTFDMIDVSWPNESKHLRFADEEAVIEFLKQRFQDVFLTVPKTFELTFEVVQSIDLSVIKPFDVKYLKGHYICGTFGICDLKTLTEEESLIKTGMSKKALLKAYNEKIHNLISTHLTELERVLELSTDNEKMINMNIFEKAVKQIRHLEEKQRELLAEKDKLTDSRNDLNKKIEFLKAKMNRNILQLSENDSSNIAMETIEILDDDDEGEPFQQSETKEEKGIIIHLSDDNKIPLLSTQNITAKDLQIIPTNLASSSSSSSSMKIYSKATITPISLPKKIILNKNQIESSTNVIKSPFKKLNVADTSSVRLPSYKVLNELKNVKITSEPSSSNHNIVTPIIVDVTSVNSKGTNSSTFSNVKTNSSNSVSFKTAPTQPPIRIQGSLPLPKLISIYSPKPSANIDAKKSSSPGIIKKKSSSQTLANIKANNTIPMLKGCRLVKKTNGQYILVKNQSQTNVP